MLAIKRSAGVTPELNVRNPVHAGNEACKWLVNPGFEAQGGHCQKSKTRVSVTPQEGLISSQNFQVVEESGLDDCGGKVYDNDNNYYAYFMYPNFPYTIR